MEVHFQSSFPFLASVFVLLCKATYPLLRASSSSRKAALDPCQKKTYACMRANSLGTTKCNPDIPHYVAQPVVLLVVLASATHQVCWVIGRTCRTASKEAQRYQQVSSDNKVLRLGLNETLRLTMCRCNAVPKRY
jgi:hypothetical protein